MLKKTRDYPKDVNPLIKTNDENLYFDEDSLTDAGYIHKGTLADYIPEQKHGDRIAVWGKNDVLILLINRSNDGVYQFGGYLNKSQ